MCIRDRNKKALSEAYKVLQMLGALNEQLQITKTGRLLSKIPLHPRLAKIFLLGGKAAALLTSILSDADPLNNVDSSDLNLRISAIKSYKKHTSSNSGSLRIPTVKRIIKEASRLSKHLTNQSDYSVAQLVALEYPDRIAKRRKGERRRYILSYGYGAVMAESDPLRSSPFIVACNLDGNLQEAKLRHCTPIHYQKLKNCLGTKFYH